MRTSAELSGQAAWLVDRYAGLGPAERLTQLREDFPAERILVTSSFGASSALLLHLVSQHLPDVPVHFIDTGYHFPETLAYKDHLAKAFGLNIRDVRPDEEAHRATEAAELWKKDPDRCCAINKVEPLEAIKGDFDVWISGLMAHQSENRAHLPLFEPKDGILKFYPLLDVPPQFQAEYIRKHQLPAHPLLSLGFCSIGCSHCTKAGTGRDGRWDGFEKTECGLHL